MKTLCSFALASLLVALPTLAVSKQPDSEAVMVQKELSPGVRLHAVDGERKRFAKTIPLASGTHVFEFTYAYDAERDQGGPWVSRFAFAVFISTVDRAVTRAKLRHGKDHEMFMTTSDYSHLNRNDWLSVVLAMFCAIVIMAIGVKLFGRGA